MNSTSCISPIMLRAKYEKETKTRLGDKRYTAQRVPCGKCPNCIKRKASQWSFRLMQEYREADTSIFITLTYSNQKIPHTEDGEMTLSYMHITEFIRTLRSENHKHWHKQYFGDYKNQKDYNLELKVIRKIHKIKHYIVGEYGSKTERPHYHAILFNLHPKIISDVITLPKTKAIIHRGLQKIWTHGHVDYGICNGNRIGYTTNYLNKKATIPEDDGRLKEKQWTSNGMGLKWLNDNYKYYKENPQATIHSTLGKISMPRYYTDKLYTKQEREVIKAKQEIYIAKQEQIHKYDAHIENETKKNIIKQAQIKNMRTRQSI